MIKTNVMARGSGKTTIVIELMKHDQDLYCLIHLRSLVWRYPKELHNRIIVYDNNINKLMLELERKDVKKLIIDEGYMYRDDKLAELYYCLGRYNIDVTVYGSLKDQEEHSED